MDMGTAGTSEARVRQPTRQRRPRSMSVDTVAAILRELESQVFDGSVEIELRAGRMLAIHKAPLPVKKMIGGVDAKNQP